MWRFRRLVNTIEPNLERHTRQTKELRQATQQLRQLRLQWEGHDEERHQGKSAEKEQDRRDGKHTG